MLGPLWLSPINMHVGCAFWPLCIQELIIIILMHFQHSQNSNLVQVSRNSWLHPHQVIETFTKKHKGTISWTWRQSIDTNNVHVKESSTCPNKFKYLIFHNHWICSMIINPYIFFFTSIWHKLKSFLILLFTHLSS